MNIRMFSYLFVSAMFIYPSSVRAMLVAELQADPISQAVSHDAQKAATEILSRIHLHCAAGEKDAAKRSGNRSHLVETLPQLIERCEGPVGFVEIRMEHFNQYSFRTQRSDKGTLSDFVGSIAGMMWGDKEMSTCMLNVEEILATQGSRWHDQKKIQSAPLEPDNNAFDETLCEPLPVGNAHADHQKAINAATALFRRIHLFCGEGEKDLQKRSVQRKVLASCLPELIKDFDGRIGDYDVRLLDEYRVAYSLPGHYDRTVNNFLKEIYAQYTLKADHDMCSFILQVNFLLYKHGFTKFYSE